MNYRHGFLTVILVVLFAIPVFAAHDRYVRLRYVEGDVTLYPADEQGPVDATINAPVMDGDELATQDGRAELTFRNGIVVRVGDYSSVRIESSYSPMIMKLTEGTLFVDSHLIDSFGDELQVQAGDAQVFLIDEGNIRIDLGREGSARITTIEGEAEVRAGGRRILLEAGERTYVDPGEGPESPEAFNGRSDELDDWNQSQIEGYARGGGYDDDYVDEDVYYEANDLGNYGDWREYGSYGNVWVPHVSYGWRPYYDGRWGFRNNSWFWISSEPWGWAPYHYGRWGWSIQFGWYWIPDSIFAPAWVGWYDYGNYIGWCPLSYYNRPIYAFNHNYYQPIQKQRTLDAGNAWSFVKKSDLGTVNVKKAVLNPDLVKKIPIEDRKVIFNPPKQLVSYVMPTTKKSIGLINDKRMIKESKPDIRNPIGLNHREESFAKRPSAETKSKMYAPKSDPAPVRGWEKDHQQSQKQKADIYMRSDKGRPDFQNGRDEQFQRTAPDSKRHYGSYVSPYYREKQNNEERTWSRDPKSNGKQDQREINPRYLEEARKIFERFDERNHLTRPDLEYKQSEQRRAEPQRPEYRGSPQRSEPPSQQYRAPEAKRPDYNRGNSGNSGKQEKHGSSRPSQPPPKQKQH